MGESYRFQDSKGFLDAYQHRLNTLQYNLLLAVISNHALDGRFASEDNIADLVAMLKGARIENLIAKDLQRFAESMPRNYLIAMGKLFASKPDSFTQDLLHSSPLCPSSLIELQVKETSLSTKRELLLRISGKLRGTLNYTLLKEIHKAMFVDVYRFAGLDRYDMELMGQFGRDDMQFCIGALLPKESRILFGMLHNEHYFANLPADMFFDALCGFYADLESLQPFREGNGRVIRLFVGELASRCGYELCFSAMQKSLKPALRTAILGDCAPLRALLVAHTKALAAH
ncbi:MAG: Fic family protein [Helicobacter sp.]|nr:Fic family protein [Helicobacter sp.]